MQYQPSGIIGSLPEIKRCKKKKKVNPPITAVSLVSTTALRSAETMNRRPFNAVSLKVCSGSLQETMAAH